MNIVDKFYLKHIYTDTVEIRSTNLYKIIVIVGANTNCFVYIRIIVEIAKHH